MDESKAVSLPFTVPMFAAHHYSAAAGIALAQYPNAQMQLLNQGLEISCQRIFLRGYTSPLVKMRDTSVNRIKNLQRYTVHLYYAREFLHEMIHAMLDDGLYVYFKGFDDYYLPEKSWYGIRHMEHDGIISGYDNEEGIYELIAYDMDWRFRKIKIPQASLKESMDRSFEQNFFPLIMAVKPKDTKIELDVAGICSKLKRYLDSDVKKYPPEKNGKVIGIAVHDFLAMYIDKLLDGSIPYERMDWRVMRVVWEFRVGVLKRLELIEEEVKLDSSASKAYQKIVTETDRLRMLYAVCSKKRKESLLMSVKKGILDLKEQEAEILCSFIKTVEELLKV